MSEATKFTPILLGSDMNVYGMARGFYEAYGINPLLMPRISWRRPAIVK